MFGLFKKNKLPINDFNIGWFQTLTNQEMIDKLELFSNDYDSMVKWFEVNLEELIKYQCIKFIEYIVGSYEGILYKNNIPNYFILDVIHYRSSELGGKYFDDIIENSTFPFFWTSVIIPEAIKKNAWWLIISVMSNNKIEWHPAENFDEIIPAAINYSTSGPGDKTDVNYVIEKLKKDKIIQDRALEVIGYDQNEFEGNISDFEPFINQIAKDIFLF